MIDITLGLDVLTETFIVDDPDSLHIHRHHPDRDKPWFTLFEFDSSGDFKVKLMPITDWKHLSIHAYYKIFGDFNKYSEESSLGRERVKHLAELIYRFRYQSGVNYQKVLMDEFDGRKAKIMGNNYEVWKDFDRNVLSQWIERWIDRRDPSINENQWYIRYYQKWWSSKYLNYMKDMVKYLNNDPKARNTDFWDWYINIYKPVNRYP